MSAVNGQLDVIINTVPYDHDINQYLPCMVLGSLLVIAGYYGPLSKAVTADILVRGRKAVTGSLSGGVKETQRMLDSCGKKGIASDIELIQVQKINEAYDRIARSDVEYRVVISVASLKI